MQKKKSKAVATLLLAAMFVSMLAALGTTDIYEAATSYSNAKEFYETTARKGELYHAEGYNGKIYYATCAKLSSSSTNLKYYTVGFDVTLTGNGHTVSFTVKRGGSYMKQVHSVQSGGNEYILYCIDEETIYDLASNADAANAAYVLNTSIINVRMDAIMTTKQNGILKGGITEHRTGKFDPWGTIYRLKNSSDLAEIKEVFSGHSFESYQNIQAYIENYQLSICYNVKGLNATDTTPTVSSNYSINSSGILLKSGSTYNEMGRILQGKMTLLNKNTISLAKTGYHLLSEQEWITNDSRLFGSGSSYLPTTLNPVVGTKDQGITLYANWQPNTATIVYSGNGATGSISATEMVYDEEVKLRTNSYTRTGYTLVSGEEWNTKPNGTGVSYSSGEVVKNLTAKDGATITLYANWQPCVYKITEDSQGGIDGTDSFYEQYGVGFYSGNVCDSVITRITTPTRTGYTLLGYYSRLIGGNLIIDGSGNFSVENTFFSNDATIYAHWIANQYTVTFDKQSGSYGSDTVVATYDELFPNADAPVRDGYSFKGYYTGLYGKGTQIYNEFMSSDIWYQYANDITLYAYWKDDVLPEVSLNVSIDEWTNQEVTLTAEAMDLGSGLKSVHLYQINDDGSLKLVNQALNLKGLKFKLLTFANTTEGIVRYKAVATDVSGNVAESYSVVYYDKTAPNGEVIEKEIDGTTLYFDIDITDINTGD